MLRRSLSIVLLVISLAPLPAQAQLKELTLKDAILKGWSDYAPEDLDGLQWIHGTDEYAYSKDDVLLRGSIGKRADVPIVTLARLNQLFATDTPPLKGFPQLTWESPRQFSFAHNNLLHLYDTNTSFREERAKLDPKGERRDEDPVTHQVAYTIGPDLYIAQPGKAETLRVTADGTDGIVNGRSVHREEYGITKGTFWSPQGDKLAFYRMDERMVTPYQLEDISTKPSTFNKIRYPMAGQTSHEVTLGVYDLATQRTVFMKTGAPVDQYLTNISWDANGKYIYILQLNRATNKMKVVQYEVSTGDMLRSLLEEEDAKWLEPLHPLQFLKRTPSQFLYWSQRDGWPHLYLYDVQLGLVRQLTKGEWVVKQVIGLDAKETFVFVEGTDVIDPKDPKGALDTHIYRVELATGKTTKLTKTPGTHHGELSTSGKYLIDRWSSIEVPSRTDILDATSGQVLKTLVTSKDPLADVKVGSIEFVQVTGEKGDVLNGRLIKPHDFKATERYPVIVYLYNGPHVQLVTNSFLGGASLWMLHAAERGYIVFTVDGHGSENRGRDFEQVIHRQLGITEVKDQLHGADFLKALPYVDGTRMAVHGWSFGGHMTTALMLRAPEVFKVGVAGGSVMDWSMYEVMYTERYMDTPEENPQGYAMTQLPDSAAHLKGDLLLIHDNLDDTVLPEHSLKFIKSSVDKGVQVDFFMYPGHPHNVRGKDRVHLYTKVLDHIDRALGVGGR